MRRQILDTSHPLARTRILNTVRQPRQSVSLAPRLVQLRGRLALTRVSESLVHVAGCGACEGGGGVLVHFLIVEGRVGGVCGGRRRGAWGEGLCVECGVGVVADESAWLVTSLFQRLTGFNMACKLALVGNSVWVLTHLRVYTDSTRFKCFLLLLFCKPNFQGRRVLQGTNPAEMNV